MGNKTNLMNIKLYNTKTGKKEELKPVTQGKVTMYVCGPTVYSYPHIGNARGPVLFDVLANLIRINHELTYVRNITDLEDKIYQAADEEGCDISEITEKYTEAYHQDIKALGVSNPDIEPKATEHIDGMIEMIQTLIEKGHAYENDKHVLFAVNSYSGYGQLSNRDQEDQIAGSRIEVASYKKNPNDFILWKPSSKDIPGWSSPWGRGRPGWHLECSTMAKKYLGEIIDIHGGGSDLIFPHHENESAQSICSHSSKSFSNHWVHHAMVDFKNTKMSKSEGNLLLIRDLLSITSGEVIRMALLSSHYRKPINWTDDLLIDSRKKLDRLYGALRSIHSFSEVEPSSAVLDALRDDLNTPRALSELFSITKSINSTEDEADRKKMASILKASASLLGLLSNNAEEWFKTSQTKTISSEQIDQLISDRELARSQKDYKKADEIRETLLESGIIIEDGPKGVFWRSIDV